MFFPSKSTTKIVFAFDRLPRTEEKDSIAQKYLTDEVSLLEFVQLAEEYMEKVKRL